MMTQPEYSPTPCPQAPAMGRVAAMGDVLRVLPAAAAFFLSTRYLLSLALRRHEAKSPRTYRFWINAFELLSY